VDCALIAECMDQPVTRVRTLAYWHKQPLGDEVLVDCVYRIFLARAAAEIERMAVGRLALAGSAGIAGPSRA
jgi:hypothetical protein